MPLRFLKPVRFALVVLPTFVAACETSVHLAELPPCDASNCADGCCRLGECLRESVQSTTACGKGGKTCAECPGEGATCYQGTCFQSACGPCAGCCEIVGASGSCSEGNHKLACGRFGAVCAHCEIEEKCIDGKCVACGPDNCAGCCNEFGDCMSGSSQQQCGKGGVTCANCLFDTCSAGACVP